MIDLHCHLFPGVDDGAPDLAAATTMLAAAAQDGVTTIVCTPHDSRQVRHELDAFPAELMTAAADLKIRLLPGMEYRYSHLLGGNHFQTLGESTFLLVDLGCRRPPESAKSLFFELGRQGFQIVLAHPERYLEGLESCAELYRLGAVFQLNADSILGAYGTPCRRLAQRMIESGFCHYVASDAHGQRRTFHLSKCREHLTAAYGPEYAELVLGANQERLLRNLPPLMVKPEPLKPSGNLLLRFLTRLRRR